MLSNGAIAGIVVGCFVALVVCIAFFCGLIIVTFVAVRFIYQQIYHGPLSYRRNRSRRDSGKGLLAKESLLSQEENEEQPSQHSIQITPKSPSSPIISQPSNTYQSTNSSSRRTSVTKTIVPKDEPLILDPVEKELYEWKKQKMQNVHLLSEELILDEIETLYNDDGTLKAASYLGVMSLLLQHVTKYGIKLQAHGYSNTKSSSSTDIPNTTLYESPRNHEEAPEDLLELFFATYSSTMSGYDLWKYIMYFLKQDEKANRDPCFKLIEYWISYYFEDVTDEVKLQLVNFFDHRQDCQKLRKLFHMKLFPSKYGLEEKKVYPLAFEFKEMLQQLKIELKIEEEEEEEEEAEQQGEEETVEEDASSSPAKLATITLKNATPDQIAEQYTLLQQRYMRKVTVRELNAGRYMQNRMTKEAPNVNRLILNFNRLGSYFAAKILENQSLSDRVAQVETIVQIIQHLANINNYDTMMALHCCLDSTAIHRLSNTMSQLSEDVKEVLAMLEELFDNSKRFYNLRVTIANTKAECCLPYFGLFLSTLNQIDAANKEFIKSEATTQKLINFNKKRVYLKILKQFQSYQSVLSLYEKQIKPIASLQKSIEESILQNDTLPTEEQLYQLSQSIHDE